LIQQRGQEPLEGRDLNQASKKKGVNKVKGKKYRKRWGKEYG